MRDMSNHIKPVPAIAPVVVADNTAQVSAIIDRLGFDALTFVVQTGTLADADATFAITMHEGDDASLSDASAVAATDLVGTLSAANFTFAADGKCFKVGYIGRKRYVRLTVTPTNNAGNAPLSACAILGLPSQGFLTDQSP